MMGATESSSGEGSISDIEGGVQNVSIRGEEGGPVPTSQLQPLSGTQVKNSAGGYVWKADDMTRLRRFLCLGTDKGTYYIGEQELTMENANCVIEMLENGKGFEVVKELLTISLEGRAAKQNPTIFCLALCVKYEPKTWTKTTPHSWYFHGAAYAAFPKICRIPTHLFQFVEYCKKISNSSGWGRHHRTAVKDWYLDKEPYEVALAVTKYKSRNGWSHRDLLRLTHPRVSGEMDDIFCYVVKGWDSLCEKRLKRQSEDQEAMDTGKRKKGII